MQISPCPNILHGDELLYSVQKEMLNPIKILGVDCGSDLAYRAKFSLHE